jgi:hypothetical protein
MTSCVEGHLALACWMRLNIVALPVGSPPSKYLLCLNSISAFSLHIVFSLSLKLFFHRRYSIKKKVDFSPKNSSAVVNALHCHLVGAEIRAQGTEERRTSYVADVTGLVCAAGEDHS